MTSAMNLSSPLSQFTKQNLPLDFSTPPPQVKSPSYHQPQGILDLCTRRADPIPRPPSPVTPPKPYVTILQQHLMHPPQCTPYTIKSSPPVLKTDAAEPELSMHYPTALPQILNATNPRSKPTRPFKAYPKDPLALSVGVSAEALLGHGSNEAYTEFRKRMLDQVHATNPNGNHPNKSRSSMKRPLSPDHPTSSDSIPTGDGSPSSPDNEGRDAAYWERRRKNNEAAKRSRDARRAKEDEIAIRAAFLEQENIQLKYELAALRNETAKLRCMIYNR